MITGGTVIDPGNTLGYQITVGADYASCFHYETQDPPSLTGCVLECDVTLLASDLAIDKGVSVALAKAAGDLMSAPRNWRLYLRRTAVDGYQFLVLLGEDNDPNHLTWTAPCVAGQTYRHHLAYNLLARQIVWGVNGVPIRAIAMPDWAPRNVATWIVGASGSSEGRQVRYLVSNISWQEIGW